MENYMAKLAHYFSVYVTWIAIPCLALIGILFHIKQKTKESLIFASGIVIIALGSIIQVLSPFHKMTLDEAEKVLSSSGPPLSWYIGSITISIGLIVAMIGFALVTWRIKK